MTTPAKDWREKFDELYPCIDPTCDQNGTAVTGSPEEPEPMQCEYCYRQRFPLIELIQNLLTNHSAHLVERMSEILNEKDVSDEWRIAEFESLIYLMKRDQGKEAWIKAKEFSKGELTRKNLENARTEMLEKGSHLELATGDSVRWFEWANENNICYICSSDRTVCGGEDKHG